MNLKDWIDIITSVVGVLSLIVLCYQISNTNKWNKITAQISIKSEFPDEECEVKIENILKKITDGKEEPISKSSAIEIRNNVENWVAVKFYLNRFEQICAAINANFMNEDYIYSVYSAKIIRTFNTFKNYIILHRKEKDDPEYFVELETVVRRWKKKQKK